MAQMVPNWAKMAHLQIPPEFSVLKPPKFYCDSVYKHNSWQRKCSDVLLWFRRDLELQLHHSSRMFISKL